MGAAGIICEYNPFHRGHAWQIAEVRRILGEETAVVCAMSGDFVQRGEGAILRAHARAESAVRGGADLVLELPLPWAIASAEGFAAGGVEVLAATGVVETLVFGSECGETETLVSLAEAVCGEAFNEKLKAALQGGVSFAAAREAAAREIVGEKAAALGRPNDILGIEYCKAIRRSGAKIVPMALPRRGVGHDGEAAEGFASASYIRALLRSGENADEFMTRESAEIYRRECAAGRAPCAMANAERAMLSRLRAMTEEEFARYDEGGEGLYHRVYDAVGREATVEGILDAAKSKRYAHARLRRMLLGAWLGVEAGDRRAQVPYLRVLACNERGRAVLREMKKAARAPILTKSAEVRRMDEEAQRLFALTARAAGQFALTCPALGAMAPDSAWTSGPVIV